MKNKILSVMDTSKKKLGVAVLCGGLAVTGAGVAFANTAGNSEGQVESAEYGVDAMSDDGSKMLSKVEDGVRSYSTDDGETWSEIAPEGVQEEVAPDGTTTITNGTPAEGAQSFAIKVEDGVTRYSTDGGETWSEDVPEGVTVSEEDGMVTAGNGINSVQ